MYIAPGQGADSWICWIKTKFEIQEHSMLYKLSPIPKHQEQIWPYYKNGQGQPRGIIWKKPQRMGIQPLGTSSSSILKLLLFLSFCTSSRKIPFALLFYMIVCFISYIYIKPYCKRRQPFGTNFLCKQKGLITDHWLHLSKNSSALWFHAHFFIILYMYIVIGHW